MTQRIQLTRRQRLLRYLACYVVYVLILALGVVVVFVIWSQAILIVQAVFFPDSAWNHFLYLLSMVLLGLGVFILVMAAEPYLRTGVPKCQLVKRSVRLLVPLGLLGLVGVLVQVVSFALL